MQKIKTAKKTRISLFLPSILNEELEKTSKEENVTKSYKINKIIEDWIQKKLERDAKELAKINFDDLPTEEEWLELQTVK